MESNLMIAYVYISQMPFFTAQPPSCEVVVFVCIRLSLWYHLVLAAISSTSGKLGLAAPFLWKAAIFVATCCGLSWIWSTISLEHQAICRIGSLHATPSGLWKCSSCNAVRYNARLGFTTFWWRWAICFLHVFTWDEQYFFISPLNTQYFIALV